MDSEQKYALLKDEEAYHGDSSNSSKRDMISKYQKWTWVLLAVTLVYSLLLTGYVLHPEQKTAGLPWSNYPLPQH